MCVCTTSLSPSLLFHLPSLTLWLLLINIYSHFPGREKALLRVVLLPHQRNPHFPPGESRHPENSSFFHLHLWHQLSSSSTKSSSRIFYPEGTKKEKVFFGEKRASKYAKGVVAASSVRGRNVTTFFPHLGKKRRRGKVSFSFLILLTSPASPGG